MEGKLSARKGKRTQKIHFTNAQNHKQKKGEEPSVKVIGSSWAFSRIIPRCGESVNVPAADSDMSWSGAAGALRHVRRPRRVVVGVSGGVDSTVSALMLKRRGYELVGAFMRNWDLADEAGHCAADEDAERAEGVCRRLGVPFREVNLVKEYWSEVFAPLLSDYQSGLTPNPDVLCNRRVKFDHFHRACDEHIGCDAVATGHYARNSYGEDLEYADPDRQGDARLLKAVDQVLQIILTVSFPLS